MAARRMACLIRSDLWHRAPALFFLPTPNLKSGVIESAPENKTQPRPGGATRSRTWMGEFCERSHLAAPYACSQPSHRGNNNQDRKGLCKGHRPAAVSQVPPFLLRAWHTAFWETCTFPENHFVSWFGRNLISKLKMWISKAPWNFGQRQKWSRTFSEEWN